MVSWNEFDQSAPDFAARVRDRFGVDKHLVLGTLRVDGSPRLSGTEITFALGQAYLSSMPRSRKGADLKRDPRYALHNTPLADQMTKGDAKLSGRAARVTDPEEFTEFRAALGQKIDVEALGHFELFRLDITEAVLTRVEDDELVIEYWRPGQPVRRIART